MLQVLTIHHWWDVKMVRNVNALMYNKRSVAVAGKNTTGQKKNLDNSFLGPTKYSEPSH